MVASIYLLDTNVLIAMFKGQYGIQEKILKEGFEKCCVSELTMAELYVGAYKKPDPAQFKQLNFVKKNFRIVPFSGSAETYGRIRTELEAAGTRLDDMDLLIGSTALDNNLILVTNNTKHFSRIPDLKLQDWFK